MVRGALLAGYKHDVDDVFADGDALADGACALELVPVDHKIDHADHLHGDERCDEDVQLCDVLLQTP